VFNTAPKEWKSERGESIKGLAVANGYVRFFEPDVYVEAKRGLLEKAGLGALRERFEAPVVSLKDFLSQQHNRDWAEPAYGLSVMDVFRHLYETERRFQLREPRRSLLVKSSPSTAAIFGSYPRRRDAAYFTQWYKDVFKPEEMEASAECWLEVFKRSALTPLQVTRHELDLQRSWHHDPYIYVFDPTIAGDLIDLWNMRLEPNPILPVPVDWFADLVEPLEKFIRSEFRPVRGNPNGVMHNATVEFARSLGKQRSDELSKSFTKLPPGALSLKHWRNQVWVDFTDEYQHPYSRLEIVAREQRVTAPLRDGDGKPRVTLPSLAPSFAERYGAHHRWANSVSLSTWRSEDVATVLPFNTFNRRWPPIPTLGTERVAIGTEGWVFTQQYRDWDQSLSLLTNEEAIIGSLKTFDVEAELSDPGHIAKQMLDHIGGLWGVHLLADLQTLELLNKMAGAVRRRSNEDDTIEETFERRSASAEVWKSLVAKRGRDLPTVKLSDFTKRNVIRLGLETECPHCRATNWHSLTVTDYEVICERCLNRYDFPQAGLRDQNRNWHFRVVGPFSVPDYGGGAYSALLTIRTLESFGENGAGRGNLTFSTATKMKIDGREREVDFVAWQRASRFGHVERPRLIVGEAKSLGKKDIIKQKDVTHLKEVAASLPGAFMIVSVLRDHFTETEKELLRRLAKWGRRRDTRGKPSNLLILLTGKDLFFDHHMSSHWKELGPPHSQFCDFEHTSSLRNVADATQQIYLNLPSLAADHTEYWNKRHARRKARSAGKQNPRPLTGG
jgi:hypothetical protein